MNDQPRKQLLTACAGEPDLLRLIVIITSITHRVQGQASGLFFFARFNCHREIAPFAKYPRKT